MAEHFVSASCEGERCFCGKPATHKVEETIFHDDPFPERHPLTSYVCHTHFLEIMGPAADQESMEKKVQRLEAALVAAGRMLETGHPISALNFIKSVTLDATSKAHMRIGDPTYFGNGER